MVSFRAITTIALVAFAVPVFTAITPAQVVGNIRSLTQKSQALQAPAQSVNIINGPLIVIGQGPFPVRMSELKGSSFYLKLTASQTIISGFVDIVSTATTAIAQMQGMTPVTAGADSDAIYDAFREVRYQSFIYPPISN
jgi:hypothetical protein